MDAQSAAVEFWACVEASAQATMNNAVERHMMAGFVANILIFKYPRMGVRPRLGPAMRRIGDIDTTTKRHQHDQC